MKKEAVDAVEDLEALVVVVVVVEDLIEETIVDLVEVLINKTTLKVTLIVMVVDLNETLIEIQPLMLYIYQEVEELVVVKKTIKMVL
jgi:hypothetical protein